MDEFHDVLDKFEVTLAANVEVAKATLDLANDHLSTYQVILKSIKE